MRLPPSGAGTARGTALVLLAISAIACGGDARAPRAAASDTVTQAGAGADRGRDGAPSTADAGCPKEGDWARCSVEDRLLHAGLVAERRDEPVRHDFLSVPGTAYQIGARDDELQVFIYPSTADRKRDTDALDSATVAPKGGRVAWGAPPTLVMSNNLAAVILSLNDRTVERLALALGAGLPQPEREGK